MKAGRSKGPKNQGTELEEGLQRPARRDLKSRGASTTGATLASAGGRSGGTVASFQRRFLGGNWANFLTESDVREPDGLPSDLAASKPPGSTAGYGKPYVRWCGRVDGRNPIYPTRSSVAQNFSSRVRRRMGRTARSFSPPVSSLRRMSQSRRRTRTVRAGATGMATVKGTRSS